MKKTIMFESVKYGDENNGKLRIDLELRETDKGEVSPPQVIFTASI